jgi:hypothetical protein
VRYWFEAATLSGCNTLRPAAVHAFAVTAIKRSQTAQDSRSSLGVASYLTNDPGVLERQFTPALVTSADSAVAGNHLCLE